jgi:hypothetical protein
MSRFVNVGNDTFLLDADLSIRWDSASAFVAYSVVMVAVVPIGFPLVLFLALYRHRRRLYPMNRDRAVRVRHSPNTTTPCVVAYVEDLLSATEVAELHGRIQRVAETLQVDEPSAGTGITCGGPSAPAPGPGHPSLQHGGEAMSHFLLPSTCAPTAAAAVDAVVRAWHLAPSRYNMTADIEARDADEAVKHLTFLFNASRSAAQPLAKSCRLLPCRAVAGWFMCLTVLIAHHAARCRATSPRTGTSRS